MQNCQPENVFCLQSNTLSKLPSILYFSQLNMYQKARGHKRQKMSKEKMDDKISQKMNGKEDGSHSKKDW